MDHEDRCALSARAPEPYPPVHAEGRSIQCARAMLSNVGGNTSEMSAVSRYLYGHLVTAGMPEVAETLLQIGIVEMHHLNIFGALALQMGEDPRLWSVQRGKRLWWSPEYNTYPRRIGPFLYGALQAEQTAVRKYRNQLRWIRDGSAVENLRRILQDEERHIEILTCLCDNYASGKG